MNIKIGGNKVNPFSVGNPVADLGDAIVGTYGPGGSGQSAGEISVDDGGSTGGNTGGNTGDSGNGGCNCGGCCGKKTWIDYVIEIIGIAADLLP